MDLMHPANCLTFNLQRAARSLMRGFEAAARESGLTAPQFTTLALLANVGELGVSQLAQRTGADRTTMTRNLEVMARRGWIAEVASHDGRMRVWQLAPPGKARLEKALPLWSQYQAAVVSRVGEEPTKVLLETIAKL